MLAVYEEPRTLESGGLGIISDIHGNLAALKAVLADGAKHGVKRWLVLGDVVAMGPQPGEVLDLLGGLDLVGAVAGNTERYLLTGTRPAPSFAEVLADTEKGLPRLAEVAASFGWTTGYLTASDQLNVLREFQPSIRFRLPDDSRLLAVHASMVADDGPGIHPDVDEAEMLRLFPNPGAETVVAGHTHARTDVTYGQIRYVNPGSVSNHTGVLHATYSILGLHQHDHQFVHRDVPYEVAEAVQAINQSGIPGSGFLLTRYFGQ